MTIEDKEIPLSDDVEIIGPGQMLRDARIALGLTENQVAEQLNLRLSVIKNIESEQFDAKVPETFMRGYLKNYAKLLNVNYQDIKTSYESLDVANRQGNEMKSFSQSHKTQAENNLLKLISIILVVVLIAVTVVWWLQQANNEDSLAAEPELGISEQQDHQQNEQATLSADVDGHEGTAQSTETSVVNTAESALPITPGNSQVTNSDTVQAASPVEVLSAEQSVAQVSLNLNEGEQTSGAAELTLTFRGDCWVNIFDASGERLAWGIKKADYVMTLQGQPPFNITLGKPELVAIDYNQQAIDMSQYQQGQIAKFRWPQL